MRCLLRIIKTRTEQGKTWNRGYCIPTLVLSLVLFIQSLYTLSNLMKLYLSPFIFLLLLAVTVMECNNNSCFFINNNWGERERAPSCGLNGRAVMHDIHIYIIYTAGTRYCACAALRANVAGRIWNRFSPAESAFSACIGSGSSQSSIFGTMG